MSDEKQTDPNVKTRSRLKTIGIILLVIGIPMAVIGGILLGIWFMNIFGGSFGETMIYMTLGFGFLAGGMFITMFGAISLIIAHRREITRFMVEETGMALEQTSDRALDGYGRVISKGSEALASGLSKGGGIQVNVQSDEKEVIKIKCRECGTLNDEDAKFCDECGTSF